MVSDERQFGLARIRARARSYGMVPTAELDLRSLGNQQNSPWRKGHFKHSQSSEPKEIPWIVDQTVDQTPDRRHRGRIDRTYGGDICPVDGDGRTGRSPA